MTAWEVTVPKHQATVTVDETPDAFTIRFEGQRGQAFSWALGHVGASLLTGSLKVEKPLEAA